MKLTRFLVGEGTCGCDAKWGLVEDHKIKTAKGCFCSGFKPTGEEYLLEEVQLLAPVEPGKILGLGMNYRAVADAKGVPYPLEPILFMKPISSIIGPGAEIELPENVKQPAFEAEIAVVIGKPAKNVSVEEASNHIFGFTLSNDLTAKDYIENSYPTTKSKSFDTFTPIGPFVVDGLEAQNIDFGASVNGEEKQKGNTSGMIFAIAEQISYISKFMTLYPGDVILTGTPPGAGAFKVGDKIKISSEKIGVLESQVK